MQTALSLSLSLLFIHTRKKKHKDCSSSQSSLFSRAEQAASQAPGSGSLLGKSPVPWLLSICL